MLLAPLTALCGGVCVEGRIADRIGGTTRRAIDAISNRGVEVGTAGSAPSPEGRMSGGRGGHAVGVVLEDGMAAQPTSQSAARDTHNNHAHTAHTLLFSFSILLEYIISIGPRCRRHGCSRFSRDAMEEEDHGISNAVLHRGDRMQQRRGVHSRLPLPPRDL